MNAISIGEVMVELSAGADARFGLAFGGDSFNTAVYLARCGVETGYATALGDDGFSAQTLALAQSENVSTSSILTTPGRTMGLYLIETDPKGERRFTYWRDTSPARDLFELPGWQGVAERIVQSKIVHLSGITLSLYSDIGLGRLFATLEEARRAGASVVFDGNFRPRGWRGDLDRARRIYGMALARADVALPTAEDEAMLFGDASPVATLERISKAGPREIVVKLGADGAIVASASGVERVPVPNAVVPVDTTAAGDSFDAGYLAARLKGASPVEAALAGHGLAGVVIAHRGAIVPMEATLPVCRAIRDFIPARTRAS